jgi:hypothetical protein
MPVLAGRSAYAELIHPPTSEPAHPAEFVESTQRTFSKFLQRICPVKVVVPLNVHAAVTVQARFDAQNVLVCALANGGMEKYMLAVETMKRTARAPIAREILISQRFISKDLPI